MSKNIIRSKGQSIGLLSLVSLVSNILLFPPTLPPSSPLDASEAFLFSSPLSSPSSPSDLANMVHPESLIPTIFTNLVGKSGDDLLLSFQLIRMMMALLHRTKKMKTDMKAKIDFVASQEGETASRALFEWRVFFFIFFILFVFYVFFHLFRLFHVQFSSFHFQIFQISSYITYISITNTYYWLGIRKRCRDND